MKYFYTVSENKVPVFTSRLFNSVEDAVRAFLEEDAPEHYPLDTFTASLTGSYLHNELAAEKRRVKMPDMDHRKYRPMVYVYFSQVNPEVIQMKSWCEGFEAAME